MKWLIVLTAALLGAQVHAAETSGLKFDYSLFEYTLFEPSPTPEAMTPEVIAEPARRQENIPLVHVEESLPAVQQIALAPAKASDNPMSEAPPVAETVLVPAPSSPSLPEMPEALPIAAPALNDPLPVKEECTWVLSPEQGTLREALEKWAKAAGWQPYWELTFDFPIELSATFCGTFEQAIETLLTSLGNSENPIRGLFYRNNRVLRLVSGAK